MSEQTSALYTHKCRDCLTLTHVNPLSDIQLFRTFIEIRLYSDELLIMQLDHDQGKEIKDVLMQGVFRPTP